MLPLPLDRITFAAIEGLIAQGGLREGKGLDFKRDPVGPKDEDKREFLADVSALANTVGGDLVFGVDESGGEASSVPGIILADPDAEIRRLDAVLRSGLEPRLSGVDLKWVPRESGDGGLLVVRTPRSFAAPHRVTFRDHGKFYARNSGGKYPLDTGELRSAFLAGDTLVQAIRRFRLERLSVIEAGEGAVPLMTGAKMVLHIVPLLSFGTRSDVRPAHYDPGLYPIGAGSGFNSRPTLEGLATFPGPEGDPDGAQSYTLLFRSGVVEAAARIGHTDRQGYPYIPSSSVDWEILKRFDGYLECLNRYGVEPPFYVFLSLLGVRDHYLLYGNRDYGVLRRAPGRDTLLLPEIVIEDPTTEQSAMLKPMFDMVANAFGHPHSFNFDQAGKYVGERY